LKKIETKNLERKMKIAIGQINPIIGDINYNAAKIINFIQDAKQAGADLVVFPELSISGYPPKDLLLRAEFLGAVEKAIQEKVLPASHGIGIVLGAPLAHAEGVVNACLLLSDGEIFFQQNKTLLPNYDVFDENRYFVPGELREVVTFQGITLGLTICEDIWNDKDYWNRQRYYMDPVQELVEKGAEIIINISASPYHVGKQALREDMLSKLASKYGCGFLYVNQIGGNDDLVFDGGSFFTMPDLGVVYRCKAFSEDFALLDTEASHQPLPVVIEDEAKIFDALVLGIRDYLFKTGFKKAIIGLSGGIDSAVTAVLAVAALGKENVSGVAMPSRYSSEGSVEDARKLAENLDIKFEIVPIEDIFRANLEKLNSITGVCGDLAEENIQARIRGNILMFKSNRDGSILLSTGNKSEIAVGYTTLYGDMCGGLAVISDVPKTTVYRLAAYINRDSMVIPEETILKPPSAELRPDQTDQDSLPPYDVLDGILKAYIEDNLTYGEIISLGYDEELVIKTLHQVNRNEYKRRQAPTGLRVTTKAFGIGRRMPIAGAFTIC
jgi:NAD+ synthase (glutamine-hydrolysing)